MRLIQVAAVCIGLCCFAFAAWTGGISISAAVALLVGGAFTGAAVALCCLSRRVDNTLAEARARIDAHAAQNEQLRAAMTDADEAGLAKSEFLATMSHEIRTPMTGVLGMVNLLLDTSLDDTQRRYARTARSSSVALLNVVNEILDLSTLESGALRLDRGPLDLIAICGEILDLLAAEAREKGVSLWLSAGAEAAGETIGDVGRLRQIILNLVANGIKFTSEGRVLVSISRQGEETIISVIDTGRGIADDVMPTLWQPFVRGAASAAERQDGTGLGLTIVRRLVEAMDGTVRAESQVGVGSTFEARIPLPFEARTNDRYRDLLPLKRAFVVGRESDEVESISLLLERLGVGVLGTASSCTHQEFSAALDDGVDFIVLSDDVLTQSTIDTVAQSAIDAGATLFVVHPDGQPPDISWAFHGLAEPLATERVGATIVGVLDPDYEIRTSASRPVRRRSLRPFRVLLAEDNTVNQQVLTHVLSREGLTVDVVSDGVEAVAACELRVYELVLMDCQMPRLDGYEAAGAIRDLERYSERPRVPIVAVSASVLLEDRRLAREAGMDGFVTKPIVLAELLDVLDQNCGHLFAEDSTIQEVSTAMPATEPAASPAVPATEPAGSPAVPATEPAGSPAVPAQQGPSPNVVNVDMLNDLVSVGGRQLVQLAAATFDSTAPATIDNIGAALSTGDYGVVATESHRFKSSCLALGMNDVAALCERLEIMAKGSTPATCREEFSRMDELIKLARRRVDEFVDTLHE